MKTTILRTSHENMHQLKALFPKLSSKWFRFAYASRFVSCILAAMFVCVAGCVSSKPLPDPLEGWKELPLTADKEKLSPLIKNDVQDYVQHELLPKGYFVIEPNIWFYEDGTGQHGARIDIPVDGRYLHYVLIYDKDNHRIKAVHFYSGRYRS